MSGTLGGSGDSSAKRDRPNLKQNKKRNTHTTHKERGSERAEQ